MSETPDTATRAQRKEPNSTQVDYDKPAGSVVRKLGGLSAVCRESEHVRECGTAYSSSTVWGWMKKGLIPIEQTPVFKAIGLRLKPKVKLKDSDFMPASIT